MRMRLILTICLALFLTVGCTRVVVHKDPGPRDKGFRFNRPKPYLYIGPISQSGGGEGGGTGSTAAPKAAAKDKTSGATESPATDPPAANQDSSKPQLVADNNFIKIGIQLKYLPDYGEEYSLKLRPGLGIGNLSFNLQDGWNLTSVNMQTNQELPEILNSVASLVGAVGGLASGGAGGAAKKAAKVGSFAAPPGTDPLASDEMNIIVDGRPDVPLGFYEAIIATDPAGRKSLFGWRYVGFMPFSGCPVAPCVQPQVISCSPDELWGIVATPNAIKFDRLTNIQQGYQPGQPNWPFKYQEVKKPDAQESIGGLDAPPFTTMAPAPAPAPAASVAPKPEKGTELVGMSLTCDPESPTAGDEIITLTVKLDPAQAKYTINGTVIFTINKVDRQPVIVQHGGIATIELPRQEPGKLAIIARYSGDPNYAPHDASKEIDVKAGSGRSSLNPPPPAALGGLSPFRSR